MSVNSIVCSYIDGSISPPTRLQAWVDDYLVLEDRILKGEDNKVVDERMNMIFDYLIAQVEGEQR